MPNFLAFQSFFFLFFCVVLQICRSLDFITNFDAESFLAMKMLRKPVIEYTPLQGDEHNPCNVSDNIGVCMFTWECVNAGGTPLGICEEDGLYGSCCFTPTLVSALTKVEMNSDGLLRPVAYGTHNCGVRSKILHRKGHVYNGKEAEFGEFPWQASMRRVSVKPITVQWCGGALINHEWIITAAHCFFGVSASNIIARLGDLDFKHPNKHFPFVERRTMVNIPHPKYVKASGKVSVFDIALLRMESPVRFQPHISPICLPGTEEVGPGSQTVIIGWGKTETVQASPALKKVTAPIINSTICEKMYAKEGYNLRLTNRLICAGYETGELDACQGDSGGPLQYEGKDGRFFLVGLVSTGIGCGKPNFPGLYTKVSPFLHWILQTISKHNRNK